MFGISTASGISRKKAEPDQYSPSKDELPEFMLEDVGDSEPEQDSDHAERHHQIRRRRGAQQ